MKLRSRSKKPLYVNITESLPGDFQLLSDADLPVIEQAQAEGRKVFFRAVNTGRTYEIGLMDSLDN